MIKYNTEEIKYLKMMYSWVNSVPEGWQDLFMCFVTEAREILLKNNSLDSFFISDVKEKFGKLEIYHNSPLEEIDKLTDEIRNLSEKTCICCGNEATQVSNGWISPFCDVCVEKVTKTSPGMTFTKIQ